MTLPEKKQLENVFAPSLKASGFKKRGSTWHRRVGDAIQVINIQGSQWSRIFYINLGVYLLEFGTEEHPASHNCHLRSRLDRFVPDIEHLANLLDFQTRQFDEQRAREALTLLESCGIPWLEHCSNKSGFLQEAARGCFMVPHHIKAAVAQQVVSGDAPKAARP